MEQSEEVLCELAELVSRLDTVAADIEDEEAMYRFDEAIRHIEIGVGEWICDQDDIPDGLREVLESR